MPLVRTLVPAAANDQSLADAATRRELIVRLTKFNLGREPHEDRVSELMSYVESNNNKLNNEVVIGLLALITAMPEYQLC
jgi:hypothetical protein